MTVTTFCFLIITLVVCVTIMILMNWPIEKEEEEN